MSQIENSVESDEKSQPENVENSRSSRPRKDWTVRIVLFVLILGVLAVSAFFVLKARTYTATAWIQVLDAKPYLVRSDVASENYEVFLETQIVLMRSPWIVDKVLESPEVANMEIVRRQQDKAGWMVANLNPRRVGKSEMIVVSISLPDPKDAEKIVNAFLDAFFEYHESRSSSWNTKLIMQLTLERNRQEAAVRMLQEKIRDATIGRKDSETSRNIHEEISRNESELDALRAELKMLEEALADPPAIPEEVIQTAVENDAELIRLQNDRMVVLENIEQLTSTILREDDPKILTMRAKLKEIEKQTDNWLASLREVKIREIQREITRQLKQSIQEKKMSIRSQEILIENLQAGLLEKSRKGPCLGDSADIEFMQRQLERHERIIDSVTERIFMLHAEKIAPSPIQLRKKAVVSTIPDGIFPWKN